MKTFAEIKEELESYVNQRIADGEFKTEETYVILDGIRLYYESSKAWSDGRGTWLNFEFTEESHRAIHEKERAAKLNRLQAKIDALTEQVEALKKEKEEATKAAEEE